jgi:hypothetical protein
VDVGIVFWIYSLEFWMYGFVTCARQTCVAVVDLDEGIADLEVGHVIVAGEPRRHGVGDFVGLGFESFTLNGKLAGALDQYCTGHILIV